MPPGPRSAAVDVATEAAKLKQQDGKALVIYGHGLLAHTLLNLRLLDERAQALIHPLFVSRGKRLFREGDQIKMNLVAT